MIAAWPYFIKKKLGLKYLTMPPLCPHLGPIIQMDRLEMKQTKWLSLIGQRLPEMDRMLPSVVLSTINVAPDMTYLLPLHGRGYTLNVRYTYQIDLTRPTEEIWSGISDKQRNTIRKGEKIYRIVSCQDPGRCMPLLKEVYSKQGLGLPYNQKLFETLFHSIEENDAGWCLMASDQEGQSAAFVLVISDDRMAHCLITGRHSDSQGAMSFLMWEMIKQCQSKGLRLFDFEGSMLPPVEKFFRSFGGEPVIYHQIQKTPNKWLKAMFILAGKLR